MVFVRPASIDPGKAVGDGTLNLSGHPLRSALGFHPREDLIFGHGLIPLNGCMGVGVDAQILARDRRRPLAGPRVNAPQ